MKKIISFVLSACLIFTMAPMVSFGAVTDASPGKAVTDTQNVLADQDQGEQAEPAVQNKGVSHPVQAEDPAGQPVGDPAAGTVGEPEGNVSEENMDMEPFEAAQGENGWISDANGWKYFLNGKQYFGKQMISGVYYYFDKTTGYMKKGWVTLDNGNKNFYDQTAGDPTTTNSGKLVTGWMTLNSNTYYFETTYGAMQTGWLKSLPEGRYYFNNSGVLQTGKMTKNSSGNMISGWKKSGKMYYLQEGGDHPGLMAVGWTTVDGTKYYFSDAGIMATGWRTINGNKYYFSDLGVMAKGWMTKTSSGNMVKGKKKSGSVYYFTTSGKMKTGWLKKSGTKYYFTKKGVMKTGWLKLNGAKYYFTSSGKMKTGWMKKNGKKYYFRSNGKMKTGWLKLDGEKYYFSKKGIMQTGWLKLGSKKYYMDPKTGAMQTGWQKIGKSKYYFDPNTGVMKKGMLILNGYRYLLDTKTGKMKTGFQTYKGNTYYFNPGNGRARTGLSKIKGNLFCFTSKGIMRTGLIRVNGSLRYFQVDNRGGIKGAAMPKGWFTADLDGKKRYSYGQGKLAVGTVKIGGTWYEFNTRNGVLQKKLGDDIDRRVQNQSSDTSSLVYVNRGRHMVRIYKGYRGNWDRNKTMTCSVGAGGSTPSGTFKIYQQEQTHMYTKNGTPVYFKYWSVFRSDHGFNGIIYYQEDDSVYDGNIGGNDTSGGVRLSDGNAQAIYNCGIGTRVMIE